MAQVPIVYKYEYKYFGFVLAYNYKYCNFMYALVAIRPTLSGRAPQGYREFHGVQKLENSPRQYQNSRKFPFLKLLQNKPQTNF